MNAYCTGQVKKQELKNMRLGGYEWVGT